MGWYKSLGLKGLIRELREEREKEFMSKGVNKVVLLGNVGRAPEYSCPNGVSVVKFSLCTNGREKVNGQWQDAPEWHNIVLFDKLADIAREYLDKGSKVYIEGKIKTHSWDAKDGSGKRYRTEIRAHELVLLDAPSGERHVQDEYAQPSAVNEFSQAAPSDEITDEDIPF